MLVDGILPNCCEYESGDITTNLLLPKDLITYGVAEAKRHNEMGLCIWKPVSFILEA